MRTPRLFRGVFVLALILPLLLVACGGSDEPTDVPSSGQATAAPTTEGAEPSPTPRATAVPPLAQTSPETDREALVALYNATGGPNWNSNDNWLSDLPVSEWFGVDTGYSGRVTKLNLEENQLRGEIPGVRDTADHNQLSLGNLANLSEIPLLLLRLTNQPVERGDTTGVGQPRQPGIAATRLEPVERMRAKQFVGRVEYG